MITINNLLDGGDVIYAGQSAGGLAALIAAAQDPQAIGVIGLDLTDVDGMGLGYAAGVTAPAMALAGEPSSCNSNGNGVSALTAISDSRLVRVTDADHCDFENETDALCTSFCSGTNTRFSDVEIQKNILGMLTAAAVGMSGIDGFATNAWWSTGGTFYDSLIDSGAISSL